MKKISKVIFMLVAAMLLLTGYQTAYAAENANMQAQNDGTLKGLVLDEAGMPVIGASVLVKGTKTGVVTDLDGRFSINSTKEAVVVVSYVGYNKEEVAVRPGKVAVINLNPEGQNLDEVVVTGYGTFKKSAYAGSASTVRTETIKDVPTTSVNEMLQGAAPGVTMISNSGQPGSASSLNVRGMGSINASNSPLYVIDGVPMVSGNVSSRSSSSDNGLDALSTLNPGDIESITVIKDAAAASLYGSRAANGVVVITTKKGNTGVAKVNLKADWGFSDFAMPYRETMGGEERRETIYNGYYLYNIRNGKSEEDAKKDALKNADKYAPEPWCGYTDWRDVFFKKGSHQNYEASISGGNDKMRFFSSLNYYNQEGITRNSGLNRISGRVNAEYKANNHLTVGYSGQVSSIKQEIYSEGTSYTAPFYASVSKVVPSDPIYNEDGTFNTKLIGNGARNPYLALLYDSKTERINRFMNTIWGQYEIIDNLKFKTTINYDYMLNKARDWADNRSSNGSSTNGYLEVKMYERKNFNWTNQLTYNKTFAEAHNFDALLGYEVSDYKRDYVSAEASNYVYYQSPEIATGATTEGVGGYNSGYRMISYIGRVNYDYLQKYFLGLSMRVDGSSRLSEKSRWGTFWSASAAWRFSDEAFFEPLKSVITDGKLRASYGANGTLPSEYYGYMGLYSVSGSYQEQPAYLPSQVANENLSWEKNYNFNIGLDLNFFDRLRLSVEYYSRITKDLLMDLPVSMTSGYSEYLTNIGEMSNKGLEIELSADIFKTKDFSWTSTLNFAHNKNKVNVLDGIQTEITDSPWIHKVGSSFYTYYLYEFAGIDPENGNPLFYKNKENADGTIDRSTTYNTADCDRIAYKHVDPSVTGAFINTLRYKWFDLSFNFCYQFGGYSYDNWAQKTEACDASLNIPTYYRNAWKNPGDNTDIEVWMPSKSSTNNMAKIASTRRVHSSDFIRLRNLTFGASLPKEWTKAVGINKARAYVAASNLWTWAKHDFYDPESATTGYPGYASWSTPPLKTVTFGLDITF